MCKCNCNKEKYEAWMFQHVSTTKEYAGTLGDEKSFCGTVIDTNKDILTVRRCDNDERYHINVYWMNSHPHICVKYPDGTVIHRHNCCGAT